MSELKRIVLTGGPCGGKSTAIRKIQQSGGNGFSYVPEAATVLLGGGYPAPNDEHAWNYLWQRTFQTVVATTQIALEQECGIRAKKTGSSVLLLDRGLLDGASYLCGGVSELEQIVGQSEEEMLSRYDAVLHLPSSALSGADNYDKASNPYRFEEADEAAQLDLRIMEAWQNHPNRHIVNRTNVVEHILGML